MVIERDQAARTSKAVPAQWVAVPLRALRSPRCGNRGPWAPNQFYIPTLAAPAAAAAQGFPSGALPVNVETPHPCCLCRGTVVCAGHVAEGPHEILHRPFHVQTAAKGGCVERGRCTDPEVAPLAGAAWAARECACSWACCRTRSSYTGVRHQHTGCITRGARFVRHFLQQHRLTFLACTWYYQASRGSA